MKVTIKEWNAVASWRWDMPEDDLCGICRVQFDATCPTCKYPGDECTIGMIGRQRIERESILIWIAEQFPGNAAIPFI